MADFHKTRRQRFLSKNSYLEDNQSYEYSIQLALQSIASSRPKAPGADSSNRWTIAFKSLEFLLLEYTAGKPIEELRAQLPGVVERFNIYFDHEVSPRSKTPPENVADTFEITQLDAFVYAFWLLALCRLLRHGEFIPAVMRWVNKTRAFNRGRDALFENVVQALTGAHIEAPRVVLHPVPYRPLGRATVSTPEERAAHVKEFVEGWYKGMKPTYWQGAHTDGLYFGYWCLEAALVTVLWDIDDSSYRDNLVYPKDLVDWYRNNPDVGTDGGPPKPKRGLRAMSGEKCPQSGNWFAPFLKKTLHVSEGESMPGPKYDKSGNVVIWYLDVAEG